MIRRTTWIILLIFLILAGSAYYYQRNIKGTIATVTPTSTGEFLLDLKGAKITRVYIGSHEGLAIDLSRDSQGKWNSSDYKDQEIDSASVDGTLGELQTTKSITRLEQPPALSDIGLEPSAYQIVFYLDDGRQILLNIGKETPTGSGYYVLTSDRKLLIVSKFSLDNLIGYLKKPPLLATVTPTPSSSTPAVETSQPSATASPETDATLTATP